MFDPDLEWERDGQYFHYLTKWALALDRMTERTGSATFHLWARELLDVAHRAFTHVDQDGFRMVWKMSIDLSRALVASMGQHDPLDGYVACVDLDATARRRTIPAVPSLDAAESAFERMIDANALVTSDPLGVGGLLIDAVRLVRIDPRGHLVAPVLRAALRGLQYVLKTHDFSSPADQRLAFRELGLAIGIAAIEGLDTSCPLQVSSQKLIAEIRRFVPLRAAVETFWSEPRHRASRTWQAHVNINDVMLATCLEPAGFLGEERMTPAGSIAKAG